MELIILMESGKHQMTQCIKYKPPKITVANSIRCIAFVVAIVIFSVAFTIVFVIGFLGLIMYSTSFLLMEVCGDILNVVKGIAKSIDRG